MKSRMRENRTYGSVRGDRQAFHIKYTERSVEFAYSTEQDANIFKIHDRSAYLLLR